MWNVILQILKKNFKLIVVRQKVDVMIMDEGKQLLKTDSTVQPEIETFTWLHKFAPAFPVQGSNVTIIHDPSTFYSTLLKKCKEAKYRITFASLYLGIGKLESELVNVLEKTVESNKGNVKVNILLDYMRGSRGEVNSRKMLMPLLSQKYAHSCQVFLYHTPKLRGLLKAIVPDRFNELIGLQHMKLYMIDNCLIISGANLSNDYFTNRQDRYFLIEDCKELCDFYDELVKRVGEFSFLLQPDGTTIMSSTATSHPYKGLRKEFTEQAASTIRKHVQAEIERRAEINKIRDSFSSDTWIFPLVQMGQLAIGYDSEVTSKLLRSAAPGSTLKLATGYFNLTSEYTNAVLQHSRATYHFLTAHPTANGFFAAKGVAGGIPAAYTKIEESFCNACERMGQQTRVTLWEFIKPGWTYHAKGLWYFLPNQRKPCLTFIGSPNFGYRSVNRDLETQVAIVTTNKKLQTALYNEQDYLFSHARPVTRDTFIRERRVPPVWNGQFIVLYNVYTFIQPKNHVSVISLLSSDNAVQYVRSLRDHIDNKKLPSQIDINALHFAKSVINK